MLVRPEIAIQEDRGGLLSKFTLMFIRSINVDASNIDNKIVSKSTNLGTASRVVIAFKIPGRPSHLPWLSSQVGTVTSCKAALARRFRRAQTVLLSITVLKIRLSKDRQNLITAKPEKQRGYYTGHSGTGTPASGLFNLWHIAIFPASTLEEQSDPWSSPKSPLAS